MTDETESMQSKKVQQIIEQYHAVESLLGHIQGECDRSISVLDFSETDAEIDYHGRSSFSLLNRILNAMIEADFHLGDRCSFAQQAISNASAEGFWGERYRTPKVFEKNGWPVSVSVELLAHFGLTNNQTIEEGVSTKIRTFSEEQHRIRHQNN